MTDDHHALYEAGRVSMDQGELDRAIEQFTQSITLLPHFKTMELLGEVWLKKGEPARAILYLAAATTLNRQVRAPSLLAEALLALNDYHAAHEMAVLALERGPGNRKAQAVYEATLEYCREDSDAEPTE